MSSMVSFRPMTSTRKTTRLSSSRRAGGRDSDCLMRSSETGRFADGSDDSSWDLCGDASGETGAEVDCADCGGGPAAALADNSTDRRKIIDRPILGRRTRGSSLVPKTTQQPNQVAC